MVDAREQYIASLAPRKKRTHPARSAQALNTSGAGIVHRNMMDLQRQSNLNESDTARLKDLRRDWNRNRKYTDAGMKISGASSPLDAQKYFVDTTRDFRDTNRDAYGSMYPLTNMAMEVGEKGGLWGFLASEMFGNKKNKSKAEKIGGQASDKQGGFWSDLQQMGSDIFGGIGIGGAVSRDEATQEVLKNYAEQTFGPVNIHDDEYIDTENWDERENVVIPPDYPIDQGAFTSLHPFDDSKREAGIMNQYLRKPPTPLGSPDPHGDFGPWPYEDTEVIEEKTQDGNLISDELWESIRDFDPSTIGIPGVHAGEDITVPEWLTNPDLPMPPELLEGEYPPGEYHDELIKGPPPIPRFDDSNREFGILLNQGLVPDINKRRPLEKEYRKYIESMADTNLKYNLPPTTYEEFIEAMDSLYKGKPQKGFTYQSPIGMKR